MPNIDEILYNDAYFWFSGELVDDEDGAFWKAARVADTLYTEWSDGGNRLPAGDEPAMYFALLVREAIKE